MVKKKRRPKPSPIPKGMSSPLEGEFAFAWKVGEYGPEPVREHRFHPTRQWRFDFAWPDHRVALEIDGGTSGGGRHVRVQGFRADCEKLNEAQLLGWIVIRADAKQVKSYDAHRWVQRALKERAA